MTFNPLKTHFMVLSHKRKKPKLNPIIFNNTQIGETASVVSLGVTITQSLSWNEHVYKLINKASKRMFILSQFRNLLPRIALERIYTSMIRPVLEFGDVLYDSVSLSTARALETIQRQSAIICSGAYRHTKHTILLSDLGWELLSERRKQHKLILFYKIYHRIYPDYLYKHLNFTTPTNYNLRNTQILTPRHTKLTSSFNSFFPSCT